MNMLLLPKIVVKSPEIDRSISRIKDELLDEADITKLWKAFTTIKRSIVDPNAQASRLENFWWRVWGSKQKYLSCLQLGSLISRISDEIIDARLCRSEIPKGTSLTKSTNTLVSKANVQETAHAITGSKDPSNKPTTEFIPHPILKKTRGTSSYGPKPTARFISPNKTNGDKNNAQTIPEIIFQPASIGSGEPRSEKRRIVGPKKKSTFLTIKKKQPVVLRRQGPNLVVEGAKKTVGVMRSGIVDLPLNPDRTSLATGRQATGKSNSQFPLDKAKGPKVNTRDDPNFLKSKFPLIMNETLQPSYPSTVLENETKVLGSLNQENKLLAGIIDVLPNSTEKSSRINISDTISQEKLKPLSQTPLEKKQIISSNELPELLCNSRVKSKHSPTTLLKQESHEDLVLPYAKSNFAPNDENKVDSRSNHKKLENLAGGIDQNIPSRSQVVTNPIIKLDVSNESNLCTGQSQIPVNIFAKRLVQSPFTSSKSTEKLTRNKSQLTLLIEGDRAKLADNSLQTEK